MASQINVTANGDYLLGSGEYKIISVSDTGGAEVDVVSPIAGTLYTFTGEGARQIWLSRDPDTGAITKATVTGYTAPFTITVEKIFQTYF